MKNIIRSMYRKMYPEKSITNFPSGFIPATFMKQHIKGQKVLIVGDFKGWQYRELAGIGLDIQVLDIVDNNVIPKDKLIVQSIECPTNIADNYYDTIIIFEVLEHLWHDVSALMEIRRILAQDGVLLVSVPFYHDDPKYHFRIHSKRTIFRLLNHTGYKVSEYQLRGVFISKYTYLSALFVVMLYPFVKDRGQAIVNKICLKLHQRLSKNSFINRKFKMYGIYIAATKTALLENERIQEEAFQK